MQPSRLSKIIFVLLVNAVSVSAAEDPDLVSLIALSLENNPGVASEKIILEAARSEVDAAGRAWLPSLGVEGALDGDVNEITLSIQQPIWTAGEIEAQVQYTEAARDEQVSRLGEASLALAKDVISVYFELLRLKERHQVALENEAEHEEFMEAINRKVSAQISPVSDLAQVKSRYRSAVREVLSIEQQLDSKWSELRELVRSDIRSIADSRDVYVDASVTSTLPTVTKQSSPSIKRLKASVNKAQHALEKEESYLWPRLVAGISSIRTDESSGFEGPTFYIGFNYSTGNGFATPFRVDAASSRVLAANYDLGYEEKIVELEVQNLLSRYETLNRQGPSVIAMYESAGDMLQSYQRQLGVGRKTWLDILNSQREKIDSINTYIDHKYDLEMTKRKILLLHSWPDFYGAL